MLRITRATGSDLAETFKLEGKLLGPWVEELARSTRQTTPSPAAVRLDLSSLTFADEPGLSLLRQLLRDGATLTGCSGIIANLLEEARR